jgi:hypothetical protein
VKRGELLSFLVGTISNVLVMEIGWTDVGSGGYILVRSAHSNTSLCLVGVLVMNAIPIRSNTIAFLSSTRADIQNTVEGIPLLI